MINPFVYENGKRVFVGETPKQPATEMKIPLEFDSHSSNKFVPM
jgi:hypothetical protein